MSEPWAALQHGERAWTRQRVTDVARAWRVAPAATAYGFGGEGAPVETSLEGFLTSEEMAGGLTGGEAEGEAGEAEAAAGAEVEAAAAEAAAAGGSVGLNESCGTGRLGTGRTPLFVFDGGGLLGGTALGEDVQPDPSLFQIERGGAVRGLNHSPAAGWYFAAAIPGLPAPALLRGEHTASRAPALLLCTAAH